MIVLHILELSLFCYLALCVIYNCIFALSANIGKLQSYDKFDYKNTFAIIIPTYKDDNIIIQTIENVLSQDYSTGKFDVIVVADQLQSETILYLETMPITLINVSFTKSTKAKSLKVALQQLPTNKYESVLILDSDNIMGNGCLEKANHALNSGFKMVQLHRTAKNKNTTTAILDAISEEIGNMINRKGHRILGLSSTLIGSGMAFDYTLFHSLMTGLDIEENPAEDREINTELLKRGYICEYIQDAFVYDEKVQSHQVLERQRTRWISAQIQYADRFWLKDLKYLFSYNIHYFDYALQTLLLPRVLMFTVISLMACLSLLIYIAFGYILYPRFPFWMLLSIITGISFFLCAFSAVSVREILIAIYGFPRILWSFLKATTKSRATQSEFIHTPKEFIKTDNS